MASVVLGVFPEREKAEDAITELESHGFNPKEMSIVMKHTEGVRRLAEDTGGQVIGTTLGGAATGAMIGGIAGLVAAFAIPGLGILFIGGPIAAALGLTGAAATTASGAATGALAGGILGALSSTFGLSEEEARVYERRIDEGGILVAVSAPEDQEETVRRIMGDFEADNLRVIRASEEITREERPVREYGPAYFSEERPKRGRKRS